MAKWVCSVGDTRNLNDRLMLRLVFGKSLLYVVSVYSSQVSSTREEKEVSHASRQDVGDSWKLIV